MKSEAKLKRKSKAHKRYKISDGTPVPGVSGVTNVFNKPALPYWANNIGLQGIKIRDYVDELADVGICAHYMIECFYRGTEPILGQYSQDQIDLAKVCFAKFLKWQNENNFKPIEMELELVSEKYKYGGRIDLYGELHNKLTLLDIKTSKAIYPEHYTQVGGGYKRLLTENNMPVESVRILRVGRKESEGFECAEMSPHIGELHDRRFILGREILEINKELGIS
jgi:hypothetical protein